MRKRFMERKTEEQRCGAVVLALRPTENAMMGLVEGSLWLDWSADRVRFWPTGQFWFPDGVNVTLDGTKDAAVHVEHFQKLHPSWQIYVFDTHALDIPIVIDWTGWHDSADKFGRRNPLSCMRQ